MVDVRTKPLGSVGATFAPSPSSDAGRATVMIPQQLLLAGFLLLALALQLSAAKSSDGPIIKTTHFDHPPVNLFYFVDSDTVLFQDLTKRQAHRSFDGGVTWEIIDDEEGGMKGSVLELLPHPIDNQKAYALSVEGNYWITTDQAKTWRPFQIDASPSEFVPALSFHGRDSRKVIFNGEKCNHGCVQKTFYTTDDFKTVKPLRDNTRSCSWAVQTPQFAQGLDAADKIENRIFCVVSGVKVPFAYANRLVYSDDFFDDDEEGIETKLHEGRPVSGILNSAAVKKYLLVAAKSQGTDELALYVTDDAVVWHRAEFGKHKLEEDAYTVLESTDYSIQVDVMNTGRFGSMGVLFTSNSNGTYFTRNIEHTNRDDHGLVDFEKIANIQGIVLVNVVDNWEAVEGKGAEKQVVSRISFDDGRTFQPLKAGKKDLHLHSVTAFANLGRTFSSSAPGLVMGVGNTGDHLKRYTDGDLYVSDDAGVTWRKGLENAHKYEFGDQGAVIMAVGDEKPTDKIQYSINHGKDWESAELETKIRARFLTTTTDSTSLKFLLVGAVDRSDGEHIFYVVDFNGLHERKCKDEDFEDWPARLNEKGEPDCLMGHKQFYRRRKSNADCFIDEEFNNPKPIFEPCKCTSEDFECDFDFVRSEDGKSCVPASPLQPPQGECKNADDKFTGPSGWRLIPGNACIRDGGENLDEEKEWSCEKGPKAPSDEKITKTKTTFDAKAFAQYFYLERGRSSNGDDETIIMRTVDDELFVTHDHGKNWERKLEDVRIKMIMPHRYLNDRAFFFTDSEDTYVTINRADTIQQFQAPLYINLYGPTLAFHEEFKDWLIWTGSLNCPGDDCHSRAYISKNRGATWDLLLRYVRKCEFMMREDRPDSKELIFCEQYEDEDLNKDLVLVSSDDFFSKSSPYFKEVIDFATMAEFIVVAARNPENQESLKVDTSVDGKIFADAEFPPNVVVPVQKAYTVLDSSTHAVFLHVTINNIAEHAYGSIIKSNSNGTSYVLSVDAVNRNDNGYVDFEKMEGLEGVAMVNVVGNVEDVEKGNTKQLKTMITHNDGAQWTLLLPPSKDAEGKDFGCSVKDKPTPQCSLHLHGYTERRDPRATYASASAVGLMFGVGNVGQYLTGRADADTFFSKDGGITWRPIRKGSYRWEYGDRGSVVVIVEELKPTNVIYYSVDEGDSWEPFQFSEEDMMIEIITTVPSDSSKNFLLWGRDPKSEEIATINLDFSGLYQRSCHLDEQSGESEDYYLWEPKHPLQKDNCIFGHVEQYHRKKPSADCWNDWSEPHIHRIARNCTCTREDYEW